MELHRPPAPARQLNYNNVILRRSLTAWLRHLALNGDLKLTEPKTLRFRLLAVPARLVCRARYLDREDPQRLGMGRRSRQRLERLQALHPN